MDLAEPIWRVDNVATRSAQSVTLVCMTLVLTFSLSAQRFLAASESAPAHIVSVVPFTNITGEVGDEWIGAGIAESLVAGFPAGFAVVARVGVAAPLRGVTYVVSGTYQRLGNDLRITAIVVDVMTGMVLRSARLDGLVPHLFDLQDHLSVELSEAVVPLVVGPTDLSLTGSERDVLGAPPEVTVVTTGGPGLPSSSSPSRSVAGAVAAGGSVAGDDARLATAIDGPSPPVAPEVMTRDAEGRTTVRAIRLVEGIQLDGQLNEAVYHSVPAITDFIQHVPDIGALATEKTEAWVMFDDTNVYVSARVWDSAPESEWVANEMRRDTNQLRQNDTFGVFLDTFYDRRNGVNFYTNPLGARADQQFTNEGNPNGDWNPVWDVRTGRFSGGWTVEMEIPFKTLRYRSSPSQVWGIQLRRAIRRKNEWVYLTRLPLSAGGGRGSAGIFRVSAAGTLVGVEPPAASRNVEVKPYAIGGLTSEATDRSPTAGEVDGTFGLDVKYGITENLTADFTYNTDFAQVEVDEQQVNLTRFSLFFPEKREFFLEGRGVFGFAQGGIGGGRGGGGFFGGGSAPTLFYSRRIGLQGGQVIPIIGGSRVTGKVGEFDVGALSIQTGDEQVSGTESTNFTVARIKRDILRRSALGGIFTNRSVSQVGDGSSQAYGVDATFAFYDSLQMLGYYARTETPGHEGKNTSYQTRFDYGADRYGLQVEHLLVEDNFVPEVGFLRRDNFRRTYLQGRFSPRPQALDSVRQFRFEGSIEYMLLADTNFLETRLNQFRFETELEASDQFGITVNDNYELLLAPFSPGPDVTIPVGGYGFTDAEVRYQIGGQRPINGTVLLQRGGYFGGDITTVGFQRGRVAILPQMSVEPSVSVNWINTPHGSFRTDLVVTRVNYAFNPRMFFSGLVQYNSARNSVSNNLRLRWEYSPGSELFVVYTEDRDTNPLRPDRFTDLRNRGFVVKFNRLFRY